MGNRNSPSETPTPTTHLEKPCYEPELRTQRKFLLLGAGEVGKSTLFKQLICFYDQNGQGSLLSKQLEFKAILQHNVIDAMKTLCIQTDVLVPPSPIDANLLHARAAVFECKLDEDDSASLPEVAAAVAALWRDEGIQAALARRNEFQLSDSADYVLERAADILSVAYVPSIPDIMRVQCRTTGISEHVIRPRDEGHVLLVDTGGQRCERKKWIHCFENVECVLFVVSLADYDLALFEDLNQNRLSESIQLFEHTVNSKLLLGTSTVLLFTKVDLFARKLRTLPISVCPELAHYAGDPHDENACRAFIADTFLSKVADSCENDGAPASRPRMTHAFVNAIDADDVQRMAAECLFQPVY